MRHFVNRLADYVSGSQVTLNRDHIKQTILNTAQVIYRSMSPTHENCDGGLYVGNAGVAYAMFYLAQAEPLGDRKSELMDLAGRYIEVALSSVESSRNRDPPTAFLLGSAGVYATASLIYKEKNPSLAQTCAQKYAGLAGMLKPVDFFRMGSDELFVGRAGYLCGALLLKKHYGEVVAMSDIHALCSSIIESGRKYSKRHKSRSPLMYAYYQTEYLGAAHGLSAILQMLLSFPEFYKSDVSIEGDIRASVDFMLSIMQPNGNIAPAVDELGQGGRPESEELLHWCHGAPGIVYLFAKAYLVWKDEKYLAACVRCGDVTWEKGLLRKGPGICHGVAVSGYVFLLLYRLTGENKYLHRAGKFAEFMQSSEFQNGARQPDAPFSLYEGLAGTACFLVDLLQPQRAEFPLFDIF